MYQEKRTVRTCKDGKKLPSEEVQEGLVPVVDGVEMASVTLDTLLGSW